MKKSLILFLAFLVVGALAFAAEPTAELKIVEFTGDASVTLGFDIDQGMAAFTNAANADIKIQIAGSGDKTTAGDGIWGQLVIKTDGDPVGIKLKGTKLSDYAAIAAGDPFYGFKVIVDKAQLNFGTIAYLGIKADGTQLDYVDLMEEAAGFYPVDTAKYYGVIKDTGDAGTIVDDAAIVVATDANAKYGVVLGITPAGIGTFTIDFRSVPEWKADGVFTANDWGLRAKAEITAVTNLTVKAGVTYSIGPTEFEPIPGFTFTDPRDIGFGGLVSYKISLGDPMYVMPLVAVDAQYFMFDPDADPNSIIGIEAEAGVRLGWGDKSKLNMFFSPDNDTDWGYYPGITAGIRFIDTDVTDALAPALTSDPIVGLNVSVFTGALVPNLSANVAFEIKDIIVEDPAIEGMQMGFSANVKYDLAMDPMTITPKFGLSYYSDATTGLADELASDIYVKAGLDIAKIFPNTTLSFLYQSNDFNGGVNNVADSDTIGMFATTLKIAF